MAILTDSDLQGLADMAADLALKDDCDILRETAQPYDLRYVPNSGGHATTWPVHATVKCAVVYSTEPTLRDGAQQQVRRTPKKILLPRGTDVLETDRLRTGGLEYLITGIQDPTSYEIFRLVNVVVAPLQGGPT